MTQRPVLKLVPATGFKQLALKEKLLAEALRLFPGEGEAFDARRAKWVAAKLFIGDAEPKVRMAGVLPTTPVVFARQLPGAKFK